jgi:oligopeptide transport system substrate-binding protein
MNGQMNKKSGWNRRLAALGGGAAALGLAWAALRRPAGSPVTHAGGDSQTLHRGNMAEPGSLDPALSTTEAEQNVLNDLVVGLMTMAADSSPIPGMAERWTTSPDGLTWTFHLRETVWSDGVPLIAEDFVFAWRRMLNPGTAAPYAYLLYLLKNAVAVNGGKMKPEALGVAAPDPATFEITLAHPAPYLLEMLTHSSTLPQPRHVLAAKGNAWAAAGNYVGNGAFTLKEWVPHERITLVKNPRFYDAARVALETVVFYPTDDYDAALRRMRAGELDSQSRIPAQDIDWIRANMPEIYHPVPELSVEYVQVNHTRKPFDDVRVREAINLAISRETVANKIRRVGDVPAYAVVPPGMANYPGGNTFAFKTMPQAARLARAQDLMRQAGFGPDRRVRTSYMIRSTAAGTYRAQAAAIQQMLALVYIDVSILANDFAAFTATTNIHDFDICQPAWLADFNDAESFLTLFITGGGNNWGLYSNPQFDAMLAASQREVDLVARGRRLVEAEAILLRDHAIMPLFFWATPSIVRPYVKGWVRNPTDFHPSRWLSIDASERARTVLL